MATTPLLRIDDADTRKIGRRAGVVHPSGIMANAAAQAGSVQADVVDDDAPMRDQQSDGFVVQELMDRGTMGMPSQQITVVADSRPHPRTGSCINDHPSGRSSRSDMAHAAAKAPVQGGDDLRAATDQQPGGLVAQQPATKIVDLPDALLRHIFSMLSGLDVGNLRATCVSRLFKVAPGRVVPELPHDFLDPRRNPVVQARGVEYVLGCLLGRLDPGRSEIARLKRDDLLLGVRLPGVAPCASDPVPVLAKLKDRRVDRLELWTCPAALEATLAAVAELGSLRELRLRLVGCGGDDDDDDLPPPSQHGPHGYAAHRRPPPSQVLPAGLLPAGICVPRGYASLAASLRSISVPCTSHHDLHAVLGSLDSTLSRLTELRMEWAGDPPSPHPRTSELEGWAVRGVQELSWCSRLSALALPWWAFFHLWWGEHTGIIRDEHYEPPVVHGAPLLACVELDFSYDIITCDVADGNTRDSIRNTAHHFFAQRLRIFLASDASVVAKVVLPTWSWYTFVAAHGLSGIVKEVVVTMGQECADMSEALLAAQRLNGWLQHQAATLEVLVVRDAGRRAPFSRNFHHVYELSLHTLTALRDLELPMKQKHLHGLVESLEALVGLTRLAIQHLPQAPDELVQSYLTFTPGMLPNLRVVHLGIDVHLPPVASCFTALGALSLRYPGCARHLPVQWLNHLTSLELRDDMVHRIHDSLASLEGLTRLERLVMQCSSLIDVPDAGLHDCCLRYLELRSAVHVHFRPTGWQWLQALVNGGAEVVCDRAKVLRGCGGPMPAWDMYCMHENVGSYMGAGHSAASSPKFLARTGWSR